MDRKAVLITNDSKTTNEDADKVLEYYEGGFKQIRKLVDELGKFCEIETYVISNEHGLLEGDLPVENIPKDSNKTKLDKKISEKIAKMLEDKNVIIILLKKDLFERIVLKCWEKIIRNIKEGGVLCVSMSPSLKDKIDVKILEKKKNINTIIYERKGVARISKEVKKELIRTMKKEPD